VKVKFTPRGDLRAQKAAAWWRKSRPDTSELFVGIPAVREDDVASEAIGFDALLLRHAAPRSASVGARAGRNAAITGAPTLIAKANVVCRRESVLQRWTSVAVGPLPPSRRPRCAGARFPLPSPPEPRLREVVLLADCRRGHGCRLFWPTHAAAIGAR
jgi:hypothetical protein